MKKTIARVLALGAALGLLAVAPQTTATAGTEDRAAASTTAEVAGSPLLHRQAESPAELQEQIDLHLQLAPGGEQTAPNEVTYGDGTFVVTYALPNQRQLATPDCPSGSFCFYDGQNYVYPRGKLSDCGYQDLDDFGWSDRTSSVDNGTASNVRYYNHLDSGPVLLFTNTAGNHGSLSGTNNNRADHVNRIC
jgi:hypothetical protein